MAFNQYNQYPQYGYNNQFTSPKSNMEWIMVPSVSDVEKVSVQPGGKAWIMVQNEPLFALRTADQMGLVQTDVYKFEKYQAAPVHPAREDYVTANQMNEAIATAISNLKEAIRNESAVEYVPSNDKY